MRSTVLHEEYSSTQEEYSTTWEEYKLSISKLDLLNNNNNTVITTLYKIYLPNVVLVNNINY